jgi:hypothetical protein
LNSIVKEARVMSQKDESVKSDKIKALANATVVDDAIRFVASRAAPATTETG